MINKRDESELSITLLVVNGTRSSDFATQHLATRVEASLHTSHPARNPSIPNRAKSLVPRPLLSLPPVPPPVNPARKSCTPLRIKSGAPVCHMHAYLLSYLAVCRGDCLLRYRSKTRGRRPAR